MRRYLLRIQHLIGKSWIWVILASLAFLALRVYYWWSIAPDSLNQDEVALLMNARFIVENGQDEWGAAWPVVFRSFGDAKLPGYIYTVAGVGKILEFSSWVVRVPALIAGLVLPVLVYANTEQWTRSKMVALSTSLLLVLSPWSWHFGSIAFEANMGLALFLAGTYCVFRRPAHWGTDLLGSVLFLFASLTYNTPWILLPVVGVSLVLWRWKEWRSILRIGSALLIVFIGVWMLTASATTQKSAITIFQDPTTLQAYPEYRQQFVGISQSVIGNQYVYFASLAGERFIRSWSWEFLVSEGGDNPWHSIPGVGHLHPIVPGFAVVGVLFALAEVWRSKKFRLEAVLGWLLIMSTLPAILTVDAPHATRSLFFLVMVTLFSGLGLAKLYDGLCAQSGTTRWWPFLRLGFVVFLVWGFAWWWWPAKIRWERMLSPKWNAGFAEILKDPRVSQAESVYILDPNGTRYPYVVEQDRLSNSEYLTSVQRSAPDTVGLVRVEQLGKYRFVFQRTDAEGQPGIYLEPNGNTSWNIVE